MKKKRKLTAAEKKLNRIRAINRSIGRYEGREEAQRDYISKLSAIRPTDRYGRGYVDGRKVGYEAGYLIGVEKGTNDARVFYEKQRRETLIAALPPEHSAWERICASGSNAQ